MAELEPEAAETGSVICPKDYVRECIFVLKATTNTWERLELGRIPMVAFGADAI